MGRNGFRQCWSTFRLNTTFASSAPAGAIEPLAERLELLEIVTDVGDLVVCHGLYVWSSPVGSGKSIEATTVPPADWRHSCLRCTASVQFSCSRLSFTPCRTGYVLPPSSSSASDQHDRHSALLGDSWDPKVRGKALPFFSLGPFAGPTVNLRSHPLIGACRV